MARILFVFLVSVTLLVSVDAAVNYANYGCSNRGNYTQNSTYQQNLNLLFSDLSSQAPLTKFHNSTAGETPNRVYGLFQCRQDLSPEVCSECVQDATRRIVERCPFDGEAVVWYYECMLRYANRSIFSTYEVSPSADHWSTVNVSNYAEFGPVLANTMDSLISEAAAGTTSLGHFATREATLTSNSILYCLAQCTPDINRFGCNSCLRSALVEMTSCCNASVRAMVFMPSCHLRYDLSPFFNDTHLDLPAPSP